MSEGKSPISETKKAYADSVCSAKHKFGSPEYQKCERRAYKQRILDWKGTAFMSVKKFKKHAQIVGMYNEFDPDIVSDMLAVFGKKIKVKLARESSPAVYVKGDPETIKKVATVFNRYADEVGVEPDKTLRIWFD